MLQKMNAGEPTYMSHQPLGQLLMGRRWAAFMRVTELDARMPV